MDERPESHRARLLSIGHGGWSIHLPAPPEVPGRAYQEDESTLSHYGDSWTGHLDLLRADAIGVDCTACKDDDLVTFSVAGPMCDASLPDGTRLPFLTDAPVPWTDTPRNPYEREDGTIFTPDARLGDASSLDYVALDVYLILARRFGRRIFNPHTGEDI